MQLVVLDGRIRRVQNIIGQVSADSTNVEVIAGHHSKRVTKRKHPGAGFRKIPGEKDQWVRLQPQLVTLIVLTRSIIEVDEWPKEELSDLIPAVRGAFVAVLEQRVKGALASEAGMNFRRKPPSISWETIELDAKAEGLPELNQNDIDVLVSEAWEQLRPKSRIPKSRSSVADIVIEAKETEDEAAAERRKEREALALRRARETDRIAMTEAKRDEARTRGWPEEVLDAERDDEKNVWGRTLNFMSRVNFNREKHAPDGWVEQVDTVEPAPEPDEIDPIKAFAAAIAESEAVINEPAEDEPDISVNEE